MTDWDTWSRILDAAQNPQYRDAVQQFLAQAELSADLPATLDEKFLAPRRASGAGGEECAYLLCNLGFAALASGSAEAAAFAMACGNVADTLASGIPDLALRRHFLAAKGALQIAVINDQPHLKWTDAATRCSDYLQAIDRLRDELPPQAVEGNAMAAYSFAGQCLVRINRFHAIDHYAAEVGALVSAALTLATRLPPALVNRAWASIVPGADAADFFRRAGERAAQAMNDADDQEHADADAEPSIMPVDQVIDNWCDRWIDVSSDSHWTEQTGEALISTDDRAHWRREAIATARQGDFASVIEIVNRHEGFLLDSINRDRVRWADRLGVAMQSAPKVGSDAIGAGELLDEVFEQLEPGTAILQSVVADADVLTVEARYRDGVNSTAAALAEGLARGLREAHKTWARACTARDGLTAAWSGLVSELDRIWGDPVRRLLDDGVTQLVLAGDTFVDIPLHALIVDAEKRLLNEMLPVTFTPSLATLRDGVVRSGTDRAAKKNVQLDAPLKTDTRFPFNSTLALDERNPSIAELVAERVFGDCDIVRGLSNDTVLPITLRPPGFDPAGMLLAAGAENVLEIASFVDEDVKSYLIRLFCAGLETKQQPANAFRQALQSLRSDGPEATNDQLGGCRLTGIPLIRE